MALENVMRVDEGNIIGPSDPSLILAENVSYGQGTVKDALDELNESVTGVEDAIDEVKDAIDGVEDALDEKLDVSRRILSTVSWQSSGDSNLSFFNIPNIASGFAPIAKIVNSDGSFTVYGFLSNGFYKATFNSSGVYQSNTKIG